MKKIFFIVALLFLLSFLVGCTSYAEGENKVKEKSDTVLVRMYDRENGVVCYTYENGGYNNKDGISCVKLDE